MKFLLGTKEYMSQLFTEEGAMVPVTVFRADPAVVTQVKDESRDGYKAVQLGFGRRRAATLTKPERGHMKVALEAAGEDVNKTGFQHLRETPLGSDDSYAVGDTLDVSSFAVGDMVNVTGISKGKGFQGGVKRHGFAGKNASHGTKHAHREVGSVGATGPQRIFKGRKMPGRMGADRVTVKNLKVAYVDPDNSVIALQGAVPGRKGDLIEIRGV